MKRRTLHRVVPNLVMSTAAVVPAASAGYIILHAGRPSTPELASVSVTSSLSSSAASASPTAVETTGAATKKTKGSSAAAGPTAVSTRVRVVPTATTVPSTSSSSLQSSSLQSQSSSSTKYVSGATGR